MSTWCWDSELGQLLDGIMKQSDLTPLKRTETRTGNLIPHHPYPEPYIWPKRFWPQPVLSWNSQLLPRTAQPDSCLWLFFCYVGLPWWIVGKEPTCSAGDPGSIPGWGRSPGEGNGNPLQYCCHGQSSLAGYSAWSLRESDMTELLNHLLLCEDICR